ncbi:unnamed protein product [Toxocara canis]|uniref:Transcriptional regulator n=1 Tax=Toxocara canis TaxID=6265 RepID=A0A183U7Y2_TOXCA|nr:unnamed protein product [Toxocara canis]
MNLRELASRPDIGHAGRPIPVRSNFFEVSIANRGMMVIQYHVDVHHPGSRRLDRYVAGLSVVWIQLIERLKSTLRKLW